MFWLSRLFLAHSQNVPDSSGAEGEESQRNECGTVRARPRFLVAALLGMTSQIGAQIAADFN
jgi:hypothetical protein